MTLKVVGGFFWPPIFFFSGCFRGHPWPLILKPSATHGLNVKYTDNFILLFMGELHPNWPKLSMFISKLLTIFWKIIWLSWNKLNDKIKIGITILVGQVVPELSTCKTYIIDIVWSITQELAYYNFTAIFEFLADNLCQDAYIIFQKSFDNFEMAYKTYSILVGGSSLSIWVSMPIQYHCMVVRGNTNHYK